ncbi:hypothetical protein GQX74_009996 [Glossina fuscipes]|nr:hypothetical protein GQX74_009996 [Glossina fuscipes]
MIRAHGDNFQCIAFTMEVWKAGYSIKYNAVGYDNLSIKFLKFVLPAVVFSLTHVLNHFCVVGVVAVAIPLPQYCTQFMLIPIGLQARLTAIERKSKKYSNCPQHYF